MPIDKASQKLWYRDIKTVLDKASVYIKQNYFARVPLQCASIGTRGYEDSSHNMEELQRLQSSLKGYKSHVTRTLKRVEELMGATTVDEFQLTSLMTASEQLQKRKETIAQLDARIVELLTTPEDLEETILETEELQDKILEKINQIGKFVELKTKAPTTSAPTPTVHHVTSPVTSPPPETVSTNTETHTWYYPHN